MKNIRYSSITYTIILLLIFSNLLLAQVPQLNTPMAVSSEEKMKEYPSPGNFIAFSLSKACSIIKNTSVYEDYRTIHQEVYNLGGINHLKGIVIDSSTNDLILVGHYNPDREPITLDDFVVALRSRFVIKEAPLVSLDPTSNKLKDGILTVRFEGGIENTQFGADLLQADYILKQLCMGYVPLGIPSMKSYFEIIRENIDDWKYLGRLERFWIYPILHKVVIREGVASIEGLKVGVFTEVLSQNIDGTENMDHTLIRNNEADLFVKELSENFEKLALHYPSFSRTIGLAELVGICKSIQEMRESPKLTFWLKKYKIKKVKTHTELDVLSKDISSTKRGNYSNNTQYRYTGGVQLVGLALRLKHGQVEALKEAVLKFKPEGALSWGFSLVGDWIIPNSVIEDNIEYTSQLFTSALFQFENKRYIESIKTWDKLIETSDEYKHEFLVFKSVTLRQYGLSLWSNTKTSDVSAEEQILKSISELEKSISLVTDYADSYYELGVTHYAIGNTNQAIENYLNALEIDEDFYSCHLGLGLSYYKVEDDDKCRYHLSEYLKSDNTSKFADQARSILKKIN
jgi:TPR repeat